MLSSSTAAILSTLFLALSTTARPTTPAPISSEECTTKVITTSAGTFCELLDGNLVPISVLSGNTINVPRNEPAPISAQECTTEVITTSLGTFCKLLDGNLVPISVLSGNTVNLPRDEKLSERDDELVKKNDPTPITREMCTATVITTSLGTFCDLGDGNLVPISILKE